MVIVAIVNGYEIKDKEYSAELKCVLKKSQLHEPNRKAKLRAIEQLIDGYLLLQQAKKENLAISSREIDEKILDIMMKYRSEKEFKEMLFQKKLDSRKLREKIANDLLIEKFYLKHFPPSDDIPMNKLKEVYQENVRSLVATDLIRVSHILLKGHSTETLGKIKEIRSNIDNKDDFFTHAEQFSECPSCCSCGDLGYVKKGTLLKEFEDAIYQLNINQISSPIKTDFGYHLIMVTEKKNQPVADFEEVKHVLQKRVQQIDSELKLIRYLKKLRAEADIEIFEGKL